MSNKKVLRVRKYFRKIEWLIRRNTIADIRRNTVNRCSLSSRNYPCRRGVEVVVSNSNMQAGARLGQVNMQNASKQKKILAEGSKLMKDEDSFLREERGK